MKNNVRLFISLALFLLDCLRLAVSLDQRSLLGILRVTGPPKVTFST